MTKEHKFTDLKDLEVVHQMNVNVISGAQLIGATTIQTDETTTDKEQLPTDTHKYKNLNLLAVPPSEPPQPFSATDLS